MIRFKQPNVIWLGIITAMTALAVLVGATAPGVTTLLLILLALAVGGSFLQLERANPAVLMDAIQQRTGTTRDGLSSDAREAVARASSRGRGLPPGLTLTDIGLIASHHGEEGMVMRRTRSVSKDDDGVRPFIVLNVDPSQADRTSLLRFEIIDQNGRRLYIHEMELYLRDGEMNVLVDTHLPLSDNPQVEGMGDWDLRVTLDNDLAGMLTFNLAPSYDERRRRLGGEERPRRYVMPESEQAERRPSTSRRSETSSRPPSSSRGEDRPLTLEELLRDQGNQNQQGGNR